MSVVKHRRPEAPHALPMEAAGLVWLAEAESSGGTRIARARMVGDDLHVDRVIEARPTPERAEALGRSLAHLHAAGAEWHCCPPPGAPEPWEVGSSRTPLSGQVVGDGGWGEAWAATALRPVLDRSRSRFGVDDQRLLDHVIDRMAAGDFDVPQPALVRGPVARLHGDLWAGNVLWSDVDTGAVLIDPHAQGGHAETDLAMLDLFGAPHLERVFAAYDEVSPVAEGWRERLPMQQLQPLLVHTLLFGGGYARQAVAVARRLA
ncbi:fructosamine kinase family protein [Aestuariimicrobium ganziense]|uniref:fructosamine kinase family protein n=1 Tax=Aestuariimicrobium ganziense TaxID=2773677 RepID=UPI002E2981E7|nr:fructosamine kinase family protein [Aestuariimicrobium ganziense]